MDLDQEAAASFLHETGWQLTINGNLYPGGTDSGSDPLADGDQTDKNTNEYADMEFIPSRAEAEPIEQNLALSCIDHEFSSAAFLPEKKSLKQDQRGRYIELSFISPAAGMKVRDAIQRAADQTGWRIRIADKVNQNALMQNICSLCSEHGVALKKNPSYMPLTRSLVLKVSSDTDSQVLSLIREEFQKRTCCSFEYTKEC